MRSRGGLAILIGVVTGGGLGALFRFGIHNDWLALLGILIGIGIGILFFVLVK